MLSYAIYDNDIEHLKQIRSLIQDYLIKFKRIGKIHCFDNLTDLIDNPEKVDVYLIVINNKVSLEFLQQHLMINARIIFINNGASFIYTAHEIRPYVYLSEPIDIDKFYRLLEFIRERIRATNVVIKIPLGERRIPAEDIQYIHIVKRCLCYHLKNGTVFNGQTLRGSFEKEIYPLNQNPLFCFIKPGLLINLAEIKCMYSDHVIFENDEILYFPKVQYDNLHNAWLTYNIV